MLPRGWLLLTNYRLGGCGFIQGRSQKARFEALCDFFLPEPVEPGRIATGFGHLGHTHLLGLQALRALLDDELDASALLERAITRRFDRRVMHEHVFPVLAREKSIAFCGVKPFDRSGLFHTDLLKSLALETKETSIDAGSCKWDLSGGNQSEVPHFQKLLEW
jgi:hypothetical protein